MLIELWDSFQDGSLGLIVPEHKTGITWTNQVGGTACAHPCEEGFFIPLTWKQRDPDILLDCYFHPEAHTIDDAIGLVSRFLKAQEIDEYFVADKRAIRDRIVAEAWVPVAVRDNQSTQNLSYLQPLIGKTVIITYRNSD